MSYLSGPELKSFKRAVISFWFRVPQASIDAAAAAFKGDGSPLDGIVPLVVIGKPGAGQKPYTTTKSQSLFTIDSADQGEGLGNTSSHTGLVISPWPPPPFTPIMFYYSLVEDRFDYNPNAHFVHYTENHYREVENTKTVGPAPPTDPVVIGVDNTSLYINFETGQAPVVSDYAFEVQSYVAGVYEGPGDTNHSGQIPSVPGPCDSHPVGSVITQTSYDSPIDFVGTTTTISNTARWAPYPVCPAHGTAPRSNWTDISNIILNKSGAISATLSADVKADQWHHVLISLDLKPIASHGTASRADELYPIAPYLDSWSRLFVAFDDKNYDGYDLGGRWDASLSDKNAVFTKEAFDVAGTIRTYDNVFNDTPPGGSHEEAVGDIARYYLDPKIPAGVLGIPAHSAFVANIWRVEMAEFQMFLDYEGDTFDTSVEANRRRFITKKDKNGVQFPTNPAPLMIPVSKLAVGDPATWQPGADTPVYVPPLFDPSSVPTGVVLTEGKPVTADVDFTKCSFNWMMGRNLGTAKGAVVKTGKVTAYFPDPQLEAKTEAE